MANKTIQVKAPKTINDLRCRHIDILNDPRIETIQYDGLSYKESLVFKIEFVAALCGITYEQAVSIDIKDLNQIYFHCLSIFDAIKIEKPKKEITVCGKEYELADPFKISSGWHIDFDDAVKRNDHVKLACLFYIPKGSTYSEIDKNDNPVNRIADRYKDFADHFALPDFMNASAFFLLKLDRLIDNLELRIKTQQQIKKFLDKVLMRGKN